MYVPVRKTPLLKRPPAMHSCVSSGGHRFPTLSKTPAIELGMINARKRRRDRRTMIVSVCLIRLVCIVGSNGSIPSFRLYLVAIGRDSKTPRRSGVSAWIVRLQWWSRYCNVRTIEPLGTAKGEVLSHRAKELDKLTYYKRRANSQKMDN